MLHSVRLALQLAMGPAAAGADSNTRPAKHVAMPAKRQIMIGFLLRAHRTRSTRRLQAFLQNRKTERLAADFGYDLAYEVEMKLALHGFSSRGLRFQK